MKTIIANLVMFFAIVFGGIWMIDAGAPESAREIILVETMSDLFLTDTDEETSMRRVDLAVTRGNVSGLNEEEIERFYFKGATSMYLYLSVAISDLTNNRHMKSEDVQRGKQMIFNAFDKADKICGEVDAECRYHILKDTYLTIRNRLYRQPSEIRIHNETYPASPALLEAAVAQFQR